MQRLNDRIIHWSRRWWALLAAIAGSALSFQMLLFLGERFAAATGVYRPFDLQNPLSRGDILAQLPVYTATSRSLYGIFIVADMLFPVIAAVPLMLLLARALQAVGRPWAMLSLRRGLALTPLLIAVLDWVENAFFVTTVALYPRDIAGWATVAITMKVTKIALLVVCNVAIAGLVTYAGIRRLAAARRHTRERPATGR